MTHPTKPTLETCAQLILAAKNQMDLHRDCGDEDAFDQARDAFKRAHHAAKRHGYTPSEIVCALQKLNHLDGKTTQETR